MRTSFIKTITKIAAQDKNVWLLTGDLGFSVFEDFKKSFPKQYLNVGVAEQNLMGVAAGLALAGKKVFVYSISTFASMRAFEQIRNDICYQNLPVFIIGGGSAFSYSTFGCTHAALEDLALMRLLPNMAVLAPADPLEVSVLIKQIYKRNGPAYLRLAKKGEPVLQKTAQNINLGKISQIQTGKQVALLVSGKQLQNALQAREKLLDLGISTSVYSCHSLKPFDEDSFKVIAKKHQLLITIEEHFKVGGLATVVAENLVKHKINRPVFNLGIEDEFCKKIGSENYILSHYGLTSANIIKLVKSYFKK